MPVCACVLVCACAGACAAVCVCVPACARVCSMCAGWGGTGGCTVCVPGVCWAGGHVGFALGDEAGNAIVDPCSARLFLPAPSDPRELLRGPPKQKNENNNTEKSVNSNRKTCNHALQNLHMLPPPDPRQLLRGPPKRKNQRKNRKNRKTCSLFLQKIHLRTTGTPRVQKNRNSKSKKSTAFPLFFYSNGVKICSRSSYSSSLLNASQRIVRDHDPPN